LSNASDIFAVPGVTIQSGGYLILYSKRFEVYVFHGTGVGAGVGASVGVGAGVAVGAVDGGALDAVDGPGNAEAAAVRIDALGASFGGADGAGEAVLPHPPTTAAMSNAAITRNPIMTPPLLEQRIPVH
jgi:hypothetical protein